MLAKPQFKRAKKGRNTVDGRGRVCVIVFRREGHKYLAGNITRSVTVQDAKVSEVIGAIEAVLVGQDETS